VSREMQALRTLDSILASAGPDDGQFNRDDLEFVRTVLAEQQAKLERVEAVAADLAERGDAIEEKFERDGNGSNYSLRNAGRGIGYREAARNIRAAITATEAKG